MRYPFLFMLIAFLLLLCENGVAQEENVYKGSYIKRPTLMVKDLDQSISLYRDILGFKLGSVSIDPSDSYVFTVFNIPAGTKVRHATFDTDKEKRALSLIEVKNMADRKEQGLRTSTVLINANGRLNKIISQLDQGGFMLLPEHKLGKTGKEVGFIDKDGHLIVLYEFPPR